MRRKESQRYRTRKPEPMMVRSIQVGTYCFQSQLFSLPDKPRKKKKKKKKKTQHKTLFYKVDSIDFKLLTETILEPTEQNNNKKKLLELFFFVFLYFSY